MQILCGKFKWKTLFWTNSRRKNIQVDAEMVIEKKLILNAEEMVGDDISWVWLNLTLLGYMGIFFIESLH
jgi:hypothetical protein